MYNRQQFLDLHPVILINLLEVGLHKEIKEEHQRNCLSFMKKTPSDLEANNLLFKVNTKNQILMLFKTPPIRFLNRFCSVKTFLIDSNGEVFRIAKDRHHNSWIYNHHSPLKLLQIAPITISKDNITMHFKLKNLILQNNHNCYKFKIILFKIMFFQLHNLNSRTILTNKQQIICNNNKFKIQIC